MNVYSVAQINSYLKRLLENDFLLRDIYIEAEISNFKAHGLGHFYLTLKDSEAAISAVMFRSYTQGLKFMPENGMKVLAGGYISIYEKTGQYQLYIKTMEPAGKGALYLAYEQLKARLEKSGVFDEKYKKPIPKFPKCVAVVTSPTGAAIRDVINISTRRNPNVEIVVVPVLVQGENSADDIVRGINLVNKWGKADTIILCRGGGSIEDLWSFNEEKVARAIFNSKIPIISAVGHETDFTISDFISDLRAPTPSAAAELAIPENKSVNVRVKELNNRLNSRINDIVSKYKYKYDIITGNYAFKYFGDKISNNQLYIDSLYKSLNKGINQNIENGKNKLKNLTDNLENKSPLNILKKGYSLVYKGESLVKSVNDLNLNDEIKIELSDGNKKAKIME
ncbi:MAG: exodeoxyribonuclease VII large subunit [Lachnospirales bacterium]